MKHIKTFEDFVNESAINEFDQNSADKKFAAMSAAEKFQFGLLATLLNGAAEEMDDDDLIKVMKSVIVDSFGDEINYSSPVTKEKILANLHKNIGFSKKVTKVLSKAMAELEEVEESNTNEASNKGIKIFWNCSVQSSGNKLYGSIGFYGDLSDDEKSDMMKRIKSQIMPSLKPDKYGDVGNSLGEFELDRLEDLVKFKDKFSKFVKNINESEVNEGAGTLKQKYEQLIKNLEKAKVPCKVKLSDHTIIIECGWDFPDRIFHKVSDAADAANLKDSEIEVCAEESGAKVIDSKRVNGGPKRY